MLWWSIRLVCLLGAVVVATNYMVNRQTGTDGGIDLRERQTAALVRGEEPIQYTGDELIIPLADDGHFYLEVFIDGTEIPFLVDTGASGIFLNRDAAETVGFDLEQLNYTIITRTANGEGRAAPVMLSDLRVQGIQMQDIRAIVNDAPMSISLLGMSFLSRLESYEVRNGHLILRW